MKIKPNRLTMKFKPIVLSLVCLALLDGGKTALAASHTWSGAVNGNWSNAGNWSSGGAPAIFETPPVTLNFPAGAVRYDTTNDIGGSVFFVMADFMNITGNNYLFVGGSQPTPALGLTGYGGGSYINLYCTGSNVVFDPSLTVYLSATNGVEVDTAGAMYLNSYIDGPGGLTFYSTGSTYFEGDTTNTFTGTVDVVSGDLYLQNFTLAADQFGDYYLLEVPAMSGSLLIGVNNSSTPANVYTPLGGQLGANSDITINPTGELWEYRTAAEDTNIYYNAGYVDDSYLDMFCRSLTLDGGKVYLGTDYYVSGYDTNGNIVFSTYTATLNVTTNLVSYPSSTTVPWVYGTGQISAGGSTIVASGEFIVDCDSDGLNKSGPGTLILEGTTQHSDLTIAQGLGEAISSGITLFDSLVVSNGGELDIMAPVNLTGSLELHGRGLQTNGGALTIESSGVVFELKSTLNTPVFSMGGDTGINVVDPTDQLLLVAVDGSYAYVSGTNNFYKLGAGNLTFADFNSIATNSYTTNLYTPLSNIFSGTFYVQNGSINFNSAYPPLSGVSASPSGVALNGPIVIGTNGSTVSCTVELDANQQLNPNVNITVNDGCHLNIEGTNQQNVGSLTVNGGVLAGLGELVLRSNVTANFATYQPLIYCDLSLGGAYRTFTVGTNCTLAVSGTIVDGGNSAGIYKAGPGELQLATANPYAGFTTVNGGRLGLTGTGTPGSSLGYVLVNPGGELDLEGGANINQTLLYLSGNGADGAGVLKGSGQNSWTGPIDTASNLTVNVASNGTVILNGSLSCSTGGLTKTGLGTLQLSGSYSNSWPGVTLVQQGALWLSKTNVPAVPGPLVVGTGSGAANSVVVELFQPGQLNPSSGLTLNGDGLLDVVPTSSSRVGSVSGSGEINLGFAQLTAGGDNTTNTFSGPLVGLGSAKLVKLGTGAWTLSGTSSFFGQTLVGGGSLFVDGYIGNGSMVVSNAAMLGGNGTVGTFSALAGSTISPGHGPGTLNSGSVTFSPGAAYLVDISGTNVGTGYNQLNVTGTVTETNPTLQVVMTAPGAIGDKYIVINNDGTDPVTGTFAGLPEGATVVAGNGVHFTISYQGGTGNDVVLTQTTVVAPPMPPQISGIARMNGVVSLKGTGAPNATYHVQANTNLVTTNWVNLGPVTASGLGVLIFTDSQAGSYAQRFYRFVYP